MCDNTTINWDAISAIGTVAGAIATVVAIAFALWQTYWLNRKKLKFIMLNHVKRVSEIPDYYDDYTCISIINTGKRSVVIKDWRMWINNKQLIFLSYGAVLRPKLPYTLSIDEKIDLELLTENVVSTLNKAIDDGLITKKDNIVFHIEDGSGEIHSIKSSEKVEVFCNYKEDALEKD